MTGALDDLQACAGDARSQLALVLWGGEKTSSRPAITSVGTLISPRRSMTVQPFHNSRPAKIHACGRRFWRHWPPIASRTVSRRKEP